MAGCDSTIVLHLTIHASSKTIDNIHACDSFLWDQNGNLYLASTTDSVHYSSIGGCDSAFLLQLTVSPSYHSLLDTTLCSCYRWPVTDSLYCHNTQQSLPMTTSEGCDSTLSLRLTILPTDTIHLADTLCHGTTLVWHHLLCDHSGIYQFDTINRYGCDSIVLLQLEVTNPPEVTAHYDYDCATRQYRLAAVTNAPYVTWSANPADSAGLLSDPPDAYARPQGIVQYVVLADWRDTLFCPAYDTLVLQPALLPSATLTTHPDMLTESDLTLYAEAHTQHADHMIWLIDGRWFAENRANIAYTASPLADSVLLSVVVENNLCADTTNKSIPIFHEVLSVPNIFIPEGSDEATRLFRVRSNAVSEFEITIYNRSGIPVFHSTDIDMPWDGTRYSLPCPQGAYLYHIRYRVPSTPSGWKNLTGTVTLVR